MSTLWLPEQARARIETEAASLGEAIRVDEFRKRLKAFDERLDCYLETQDHPEGDTRLGFWYILRHNEDGTVALWEVNDMGAFREPDERDIEALRMLDLRNPARGREMRERRDRKLAEKQAAKDRARDEQIGQADEIVQYMTRVQVPVSRDLAA